MWLMKLGEVPWGGGLRIRTGGSGQGAPVGLRAQDQDRGLRTGGSRGVERAQDQDRAQDWGVPWASIQSSETPGVERAQDQDRGLRQGGPVGERAQSGHWPQDIVV
eukprot:gene16785-23061_t